MLSIKVQQIFLRKVVLTSLPNPQFWTRNAIIYLNTESLDDFETLFLVYKALGLQFRGLTLLAEIDTRDTILMPKIINKNSKCHLIPGSIHFESIYCTYLMIAS